MLSYCFSLQRTDLWCILEARAYKYFIIIISPQLTAVYH